MCPIDETASPHPPLSWLFVPRAGRIIPIPVARISRIEAHGEYVKVHAGQRDFLLDSSLTHLEEWLPAGFIRVHRSHLVHLNHVDQFVRIDERRFEVRMKDGTAVIASRAGSQGIRALMRLTLAR